MQFPFLLSKHSFKQLNYFGGPEIKPFIWQTFKGATLSFWHKLDIGKQFWLIPANIGSLCLPPQMSLICGNTRFSGISDLSASLVLFQACFKTQAQKRENGHMGRLSFNLGVVNKPDG